MVDYCKCAFVDSNGDFAPGEACQVHPNRVPERTPGQLIQRLQSVLAQKAAQIERLQNTVQKFQRNTDEHASCSSIPRRSRTDLWIPAERAINDALIAVEALGAHPDLTAIVSSLSDLQRKVADWYDGDRPGASVEYRR